MNVFERFIEKHFDWKWDVEELSENPSITLNFIERHPEMRWKSYMKELSNNPSITPDFIERHSEMKWDMNTLSQNPIITPEFIERHPEYGWSKLWLSCNTFMKSINNEKKELFLQSCNYNIDIKKSFTHQSSFDRNLLKLILQFV